MIIDCNPDDIGISESYPLPGTQFYDNVKEQMVHKTNWKDSDDLDMMFSGSYAKPFYKILHRLVHAEYRTHKIITDKNWRKSPNLFLYSIRFIVYRLKLMKYLAPVKKKSFLIERKEIYHSI